MDKFSIVAGSPVFRMLEQTQCQSIADAAEFRRIETTTDAHLFRYGEPASAVFLIVPTTSGQEGPVLQVSFGAPVTPQSPVGFRLTEGDIAGDVEFLLGGLSERLPPRISSARILRNAAVLTIPAAVLARIAQTETDFRRRIVRHAAQRLTEIASVHAERKTMHPEVRFATSLLSLLDDFGHIAGNKGVFDHRLRQRDLADNLGISLRLLSLRFSDWSARGLLETVPITLPDVARVERIAGLSPPNVARNLRAVIENIEDQTARGLLAKASQTAADVLSVFSDNPVVAYQLALISVRLGAIKQAKDILAAPMFAWTSMSDLKARLRAAWKESLSLRNGDFPGYDEVAEQALDNLLEARLPTLAVDIGGLHARLCKETLVAHQPGLQLRQQALEAARLYREVHEASPNHYCAVNGATLSMLGGLEDDARALALVARRLAARESTNYWALASLGEASLVLSERQSAIGHFAAAAAAADADLAKITSTRHQLALISAVGGLDTTAELAALDTGDPIVFSGHIMRPSDGTPGELVKAENLLATEMRRWLAGRKVPAVFMSLACGADIVFAELVLEAGIPLNVTLPFTVGRFCDLSVAIGNASNIETDWVGRYFACLDEAASVTELWKHEIRKAEIDYHYLATNLHLIGETIFAAAALMAQPRMLAVVHPNTVASIAGARNALAEFVARGFNADVIDAKLRRKETPDGARGADPFAPMVFAFARCQQDNAEIRRLLDEAGFAIRVLKDRRIAGHYMPSGFEEAHFIASRLATLGTAAKSSPRVICDFGPIRGRDGAPILEDILKLDAAADLSAVAIGNVFATSAFVMREVAGGGKPDRYSVANISIEPHEDGQRRVLRGAKQIYKVRET
ncbi:MAG: Crp/Fnr family transcriptional regulator [Mesorhizobium sp.]|uniref:Crp/Fnr family transcriptional regulator n=1 Tax=Mesorhizobium sp. TaxID=1871066 RepID=UPI00121A7AC4|nr:Crp/Fnr family transcriptional regulator [Mesorhizobium sp.]TIQ33107.1 MAG: Crp/Fnr family transcriptional regulator [Mesorhizobium sp.]